jgi:hypothetical protein
MAARNTLVFFALVALAGTASAQRMAPGLWEHTMTMKGGGAEAAMAGMQQQLANMPPEQRKQVEQMMAQQGMGMGAAPNAMRVCISPAMADKPDMPQNEKGCQQENMQRSGSTMRYKFRCDGPPRRSGEGEFTMQGDKAYSGRAVFTSEGKGQPDRMEMAMTGRFVSADCGALKPAR